MRVKDFRNKAELLDYLDDKAMELRKQVIDLSMVSTGGHLGGAFSMMDIVVALYYHTLKVDPHNPTWAGRDRFVLSKGHGAIAYVPILADLGFFPKEWLSTFNKLDSPFGMHPDMHKIPGVEMSTGSLGHGLSIAVGMALSARLDKQDSRIFVLMGDGELNEGMVWEAAQAGSHFKLGNIVAIVDRNRFSLDGPTEEIMSIEPIRDRWEAFGWKVYDIDGHDMEALVDTFNGLPPASGNTPILVIARTTKGKGVDFMENNPIYHYTLLDKKSALDAFASIERSRPARRVTI
jgi:transketolase